MVEYDTDFSEFHIGLLIPFSPSNPPCAQEIAAARRKIHKAAQSFTFQHAMSAHDILEHCANNPWMSHPGKGHLLPW